MPVAPGGRPAPRGLFTVRGTWFQATIAHSTTTVQNMETNRCPPRSRFQFGASGLRAGPALVLALFLVLLGACGSGASESSATLSARDRDAIAREVEQRLRDATNLRGDGDAIERVLSLYPDSGRVVSVAAGEVTTTRDSLADAVRYFWTSTGQNMQSPDW
jgi:hypothetical protein